MTLAWNSTSDLDIQVRDPRQELITAYHPRSASGGAQDVDANPTALTPEGEALYQSGRPPGAQNVVPIPDAFFDMGESLDALERLARMSGGEPESGLGSERVSKVPSLHTHRPVEHIYFAHAPSGVYTVYASCFSWREKTQTPLPFTIEVRSRGQVVQSLTSAIGPRNYCADGAEPIIVCQFVVR